MKPYYQDEWVTIYHGDCREILPELPKVDLVLTDPPYLNMGESLIVPPSQTGVVKGKSITRTIGDEWGASLGWIEDIRDVVKFGILVFCSFHSVDMIPLALGDKWKKIILITWHKRNAPHSLRNRPHYTTEFVWALERESNLAWNELDSLYDIPKLATGCMASKERFVDAEGRAIHPTQKPELLISELIKCASTDMIILDPFLGSGTTAYCAKKLNRKCIGIEIEEKYCEIAAKRCSQQVMNLRL